jgi:hypothetical protein
VGYNELFPGLSLCLFIYIINGNYAGKWWIMKKVYAILIR